jgi:hypothetical protein
MIGYKSHFIAAHKLWQVRGSDHVCLL